MKIVRNGMEFELTGDEMIAAWMDVEKWRKIEELERAIKNVYEEASAAKVREAAIKMYEELHS